jgi:glycosyltransferase involved in cell wall biosynthesis
MNPTISVIMPVYNAVDYVSQAIDSILGQTFQDFEFIIVEDGSDDGAREVVADRAKDDTRIRLIQLERDETAVSAARPRNIGAQVARGGYIACQDDDDIAVPHRLAAELAWMRASDLDAIGGQLDVFGQIKSRYWCPQTHEAILNELVFRPSLFHTTKLVKTRLMLETPYPEVACEDYAWQVCAIGAGAKMGNLPEVMARRRVWDGQTTALRAHRMRKDRRAYRWRYLFARYPDMTLPAFRVLDRVAYAEPLANRAELEIAAHWILKLSRLPDPALHGRMRRRWSETCAAAAIPVDADWRGDIDARIGSD